ncbi:MAG TPA: protein kinase [Labilithrix sp.]
MTTPLAPGETIGRYRIERHLGSGGMGDVYVAEDTALERRVALKVTASPSSVGRERFLREGKAVAALDHPNIVTVFDVGAEGERLFLAMEYVEGYPMRDAIGRAEHSVTQRIRWLVEIADALAAAHRARIVHRDVKPDNVVIGKDMRARVLDFGIAQRAETGDAAATTQARLTAENAAIGTPAYMAPEQLRGEPVDARADQFAWGVMAYELLSGQHPFLREGSPFALISAILEKTPAPLATVAPDVPRSLAAIVDRTLAKDAGRRYASFDALLPGLQETAQALVVSVPRTASPDRGPTIRSRVGFVFIAIAVAAAAAVAISSRWIVRREPAPASAPSASATAITDLPVPDSPSAEARVDYRKALQAFHDANWETAAANLESAVKADPGMAAAHLRLAIYGRYAYANEPARARKSFEAANQLRSSLSPRDAKLLEAQAPYFTSSPPDAVTSAARLTAASDQYPRDAELAFYASYEARDEAGRLALVDRALAADPTYADALQMKAHLLRAAKRNAEADATLETCIAAVPASQCLEDRIMLRMDTGQCASMETDALAWATGSGGTPTAYQLLATALTANRRPEEAVRDALSHRWSTFRPEERDARSALEDCSLHAAYGGFVVAESLARKAFASDDVTVRKGGARRLVEIFRETGRRADADALATRVLNLAYAWNAPGQLDDITPIMIEVRHQARSLSTAEAAARLDAWVEQQRRSVRAELVPQVPAAAYVGFDPNADEASANADKLGDALPDTSWVSSSSRARFARMRFLAKRADSVRELEAASASCAVLYDPFTFVRAKLWLGEALEASDRASAACEAYAQVLAWWGAATPAAASADEARRRMKILACDKR